MLINVRFLFTIDSKISINDILKVLNDYPHIVPQLSKVQYVIL
jgi:hypothetical protein